MNNTKLDWHKINSDTLVSKNYAYFDTAAAASPPKPVIDKVKSYLDETAELGTYLPSLRKRVYSDLENTRSKMARFINAEKDEIAFVKNGTEAICLVAQSINWHAGDEIIIPDTEMLSNVSIWLSLESQKGVKVIRAKANKEGLIEVETIKKHVTKKTRLISFVALSNVTGVIQNVKEICNFAKKNNILSHVNASQALGMLNIDIQNWQNDFLSASCRKGLRSIEGVGILYANKLLIPDLNPALIGWWNSSINTDGKLVLPMTAKRFEAGCPNIPSIYSLDAAIDYANLIGQSNIENRVHFLTEFAINKLHEIKNFEFYGSDNKDIRMGIIPFNIKNINPANLVAELENRKIIIEAGHFMASSILSTYNIDSMARISIHYFNSESEIDLLIANIIEIQGDKL